MIPIITVFSYVIGRPDKEFTKLSFAERMNHYYKQVDEGLK